MNTIVPKLDNSCADTKTIKLKTQYVSIKCPVHSLQKTCYVTLRWHVLILVLNAHKPGVTRQCLGFGVSGTSFGDFYGI